MENNITIMDIVNFDNLTIDRQIETLCHYDYINNSEKNKNMILQYIFGKRLSIGVIDAANELVLKPAISTPFEDIKHMLKLIEQNEVYDSKSFMKELKGSLSMYNIQKYIVMIICEIEDLNIFKKLILNNKDLMMFVFKENLNEQKKELFNKYSNTTIYKVDDIVIEERVIENKN